MRKRKAPRAISLGGQPSFNWQYQGDSEENESIITPASTRNRSQRFRLFLASSAVVILLSAALVGQRLMQRAEANLAQVEAEVAGAITLENSQRQATAATTKAISQAVVSSLSSSALGSRADANVTLLMLYGNLALVDVTVNNPVESWYSEPYRVARIMRQESGGWRPITPVNIFWSERRTLETTYFHLEYSRRDERAVQEVAGALDELYVRLHNDLGLPRPSPAALMEIQIAVVEGSDVRVTDLRYSGRTLIVPPPELIPRPSALSNAETLRQSIAFPLSVKIFDASQTQFPIPCNWRALGEGIGLWLRWEGHTLPSRRRWEYERVINEWSKPAALPRLEELLSVPRDCWQPPPYLEMSALNSERPMPRNELSATLIEYMVATYSRQFIPILLRDLNQFSDWNSLAQNTVNVSADELEAGWQAYLKARRQ
jgi:hypothetical protein